MGPIVFVANPNVVSSTIDHHIMVEIASFCLKDIFECTSMNLSSGRKELSRGESVEL